MTETGILTFVVHMRAFVVVNNSGQQRLTRVYDSSVSGASLSVWCQAVLSPASRCAFAELADATLVHRAYATLHFVVVLPPGAAESPLVWLDLIDSFVGALDGLWEEVCELDLVFSWPLLHAVLDELVVGGLMVGCPVSEVVASVRHQSC